MRKWLSYAPRVLSVIAALYALSLSQEPRSLAVPQALASGDAAAKAGRAADALRFYRTALDTHPNDPRILMLLTEQALAASRPDTAEQYLAQWVRVEGGYRPLTQAKAAELAAVKGNGRQAVLLWRASLNGTAQDLPTLRKLTTAALNLQDWASAIQALRALLQFAPDDHHALFQLGLLSLPADRAAGMPLLDRAALDPDYQQAVIALRATVAQHQSATPANFAFQIGLALVNQQRWVYAERAFTLAIERGNRTPITLAMHGLSQDQQGRDGKALLEQALSAAPTDPGVLYIVGLHYRRAGNLESALDQFAKAIALDPNNAAILAEIGLCYQALGQLDSAAQFLTAAAQRAPQNIGFRTLLATFYADTNYGLTTGALPILRQLSEQAPQDADIRASYGWALFVNQQFDTARVELESALVINPTNPRTRYFLAIFLENRGDTAGAQESYLYIYRNAPTSSYRELAAGALRRLGYTLDPNNAGR